MLLNFSDQTRTGVFNMVWSYTVDNVHKGVSVPSSSRYLNRDQLFSHSKNKRITLVSYHFHVVQSCSDVRLSVAPDDFSIPTIAILERFFFEPEENS